MISIFQVIDKDKKLRFEGVRQIDAEFHARHLIVDRGEEKPDIFAIEYEPVDWTKKQAE